MLIRSALPEDAGRILEIYSHYVEKTAVSFEYDVPSVEEFRARIVKTLERYPYLSHMGYATVDEIYLEVYLHHSLDLKRINPCHVL